MRTRTRRRLDMALVAGGVVVVVPIAAVIGAAASDQERMERMWTVGELTTEGTFQVSEVIDWDFGLSTDRHGIEREVPGLSETAPITVSSPNAPDGVQLFPEMVMGEPGVRIRIGDPNTTVSGSKRYEIGYPLTTGIVNGDRISWDAVGTGWDYDIEHAEVHVLAPAELSDVACGLGTAGGALTGCTAEQVEPGHLLIEADDISPGEGITVEATLGAPLAAAPTAPSGPGELPEEEGTGIGQPVLLGLLAAGAAAVPTSIMVRRAGRERIAPGGATEAAYAGAAPFSGGGTMATSWPPQDGAPSPWPPQDGAPAGMPPGVSPDLPPGVAAHVRGMESVPGELRVDADELASMATTDFAPPAGVRPEHGGIILAEAVKPEHKTAWLIEAAIEGAIDIRDPDWDGKDLHLIRTGPGSEHTRPVLDEAFGGRTDVQLGTYDSTFARGWSSLGSHLEHWRRTAGLWDPRGGTRRVLAVVLGIAALIIGELIVVGGAFLMASRDGGTGAIVVVTGAVLAGAGLAAALRSWELKVRTPLGSALWLRVESFRRFLAGSEAYHAEEAAKRGVLREYTAWAVAVGEIDRWRHAVTTAVNIPGDAGLHYVYMAPLLASSTTSTATAPSSSGGGGGGGSIGGGGGGGGGGSW